MAASKSALTTFLFSYSSTPLHISRNQLDRQLFTYRGVFRHHALDRVSIWLSRSRNYTIEFRGRTVRAFVGGPVRVALDFIRGTFRGGPWILKAARTVEGLSREDRNRDVSVRKYLAILHRP